MYVNAAVHRGYVVQLLVIAVFIASPLGAQETRLATTSRDAGGGASIASTITKVLISINSPESALHPIINVVPSGGGVGFGLEHDGASRRGRHTTARGVITTRQYWSAELGAGYQSDRSRGVVYGRVRDMSQLSFFGLGADSDVASRTNFRLRDPVIGGIGLLGVGRWVAIGGRVEAIWPDVGRGRSSTEPTIDQRFDEADAPGLTAQPRFGRYEALAEIRVPPGAGEALHQGARYRIAYAVFHDQQFNRFSFHRVDVEGQQRFALFHPYHRLTLHGRISTTETDAGHDVPFYFQRTLGGRGMLRSVHDDLLGSDDTQATLRGFRSMRFRDRHLLLLQAEYRAPVWGPVDATLFADAGKVTSRRADLGFADLKGSYGFSVSLMRGPAAAARVDVGFGGGEGTQVILSFGRELLP